jgi:hypothetical protein
LPINTSDNAGSFGLHDFDIFAMLFRPLFQASSEGGDRRNDNKSNTIQDPVKPEIARNRGVHVFKQIFVAIT